MPGLSARSQVANSHPEQGHAGQAWEQACREGGGEGGLGQARLQACREDGGGVYMGMGGGGSPQGMALWPPQMFACIISQVRAQRCTQDEGFNHQETLPPSSGPWPLIRTLPPS